MAARPEFSHEMAIQSGRHPIKSHLQPTYVPNEVYAGDEASFQLITGPNMSGKSTYLRQIALLSIQAQIGSYVPAKYACFRICDAVLSRLGNDDSLEVFKSYIIRLMAVECIYVYGRDEGHGVYPGEHYRQFAGSD